MGTSGLGTGDSGLGTRGWGLGTRDSGLGREVPTTEEAFAVLMASRPSPDVPISRQTDFKSVFEMGSERTRFPVTA
jgi:hypothetical protein